MAHFGAGIGWRVRFDDTLETVLTTDLTHPQARQSAWRQVVDLIGRRRAPADPRAIAILADIQSAIPLPVRTASARALVFANPPAALVRLLAADTLTVAAPVLASARLEAEEWMALLPDLTPSTRAVLRNRRDLPEEVVRALASFGPADMVLTDQSPKRAASEVAAAPSEPVAVEPVVEQAAAPIVEAVAEPAPDATPEPAPEAAPEQPEVPQPEVPQAKVPQPDVQGPFRIADVVARITAFQRQSENKPRRPAAAPGTIAGFRFETDSRGVLCRVEGIERGPLIGLSLAQVGDVGLVQLDGVAAGAFRRRAGFASARLHVGGSSEAAGDWQIGGAPMFDPGTGRFTGYRGSARRPRREERAEPAAAATPSAADTLRQLVHELRTPAGAIASFAEMIEAQMLGPVPGVYRDQAGVIRQQARELLGVIDDLDLAARIEGKDLDLRPDAVAIGPLLEEIEADLAPLTQLRGAELRVEPIDGAVQGDRRAVERLLARLLATLVSAAQGGELLTVRPLDGAGGQVLLAFDRPSALSAYPGEAMLTIDDEGDDAALLGTGFAMRLVRNLAKELGGALLFERDRLVLRLPAREDVPVGQAHRG